MYHLRIANANATIVIRGIRVSACCLIRWQADKLQHHTSFNKHHDQPFIL